MSRSGNVQSQIDRLSGHYLDLFTKVKYDDLYTEPRISVHGKTLMLKFARDGLTGSTPGNPNTEDQWPNAESREAIATAIVLNHTESGRQRLTGFFLEKYPDQTDWLCDAFLWLTPYLGFPSVMSALASIPQARKGGQKVAPYTYQSPALQKLYGITVAGKVAERLNEISPAFNRLCQHIAYDEIWGSSSGDYRSKSLMTIATLVILGLQEQLTIHLNGFANVGGSSGQVLSLATRLRADQHPLDIVRVEAAIKGSTLSRNNTEIPKSQNLSESLEQVLGVVKVIFGKASDESTDHPPYLMLQCITYAGTLRLRSSKINFVPITN